MSSDHPLLNQDIATIVADRVIPWDELRGTTVLVTGATGLIGGLLCKSLLNASVTYDLGLKVVALVRNKYRAAGLVSFQQQLPQSHLELIEGDICQPLDIEQPVHAIIHAAAPTASSFFVQHPVETIETIYSGTRNILEFARKKQIETMLYISSMEVYGQLDHVDASEEDAGYVNPLSPRSSYPQAKRLAETLCAAYFSEYGLPVKTVRPTLVFGPGVRKDDNRVFMQMARAALTKGEIRLASSGATERDFIYTTDACRLFLSVLLKGKNGKAYNVGNPDNYMSILELAHVFQKQVPEIAIKINSEKSTSRYASEIHIRLNCDLSGKLNNFPKCHIDYMISRLLSYLK